MLFKRKQEKRTYDRENLKPVIRSSICTGEQVAGFRNIHTGKFSEVMLLRTDADLEEFLELYDIPADGVSTEY